MFHLMEISKVMSPLAFYFIIYSFLGWILENTHSYFTRGYFLKPNFLVGPFKPMYGFAPIILVYSLSANTHWTIILLLSFLVPTAVEYISGFLLKFFFQKKWWDYSGNRFNLQGHICLSYSLCWIFLSLLCVYFIHPIVASSYMQLEHFLFFTWPVVIGYFFFELFLAVKRHSVHNKSIETLG